MQPLDVILLLWLSTKCSTKPHMHKRTQTQTHTRSLDVSEAFHYHHRITGLGLSTESNTYLCVFTESAGVLLDRKFGSQTWPGKDLLTSTLTTLVYHKYWS